MNARTDLRGRKLGGNAHDSVTSVGTVPERIEFDGERRAVTVEALIGRGTIDTFFFVPIMRVVRCRQKVGRDFAHQCSDLMCRQQQTCLGT